MKKEDLRKAVEICMGHRGTVEFRPAINGFVQDDALALTSASPALVNDLVKNGYSLNLEAGRVFIAKY